jgi:ribokinase
MKNYTIVFGCCEEDHTYYEKTQTTDISFGGKGANQAVAHAKAGRKTIMLTKFSSMKSEMPSTTRQVKNFKKNKVSTKYIEYDDKNKNEMSKIEIDLSGDNTIHECIGMSQTFSTEYLLKNEKLIKNSSFVILQLKTNVEITKELFKICKKHNIKTCLTPCRTHKARANMDFIEDATFVTLNEKEMINLFGKEKEDGTFSLTNKQMDNILKKYPNKIILTLGEKGVKYCDGKDIVNIPAVKVENVVNTTGAGDTFCGNFVACILDGDDIKTSIKKAICASTIKIQKEGTQNGMPFKKERDTLYKKVFKEIS